MTGDAAVHGLRATRGHRGDMTSISRYVEALLWMDRESPIDDAEFIVRLARPSRWPAARFGPDDVDRAAGAIRLSPLSARGGA